MDSHIILGTGNLWKRVIGLEFTLLFLLVPDNQNQNPFKIAIQGIKASISKIGNACGAGVIYYEYNMWE